MQYARYDRLNNDMYFWDGGVNWFLKGQTSKITLSYNNRPVYQSSIQNNKANKVERKGTFVLQYQVFFN